MNQQEVNKFVETMVAKSIAQFNQIIGGFNKLSDIFYRTYFVDKWIFSTPVYLKKLIMTILTAQPAASASKEGEVYIKNISSVRNICAIIGGTEYCSPLLADGNALASYGIYTPTRSAESNLDANVTMSQCQYMRVGATVTVSGRFTADPTTTATDTSFEFTLPIASDIALAPEVAGVAFCGSIAGQGAAIVGVAANNTAKVIWKALDVTEQTWSFTFTYRVI